MKLRLIEKKSEINGVISFIFEPEHPINFNAGQFLKYTFDHPNPDQRGINRYFTISSSPHEGFLMLTTRFATDKGSSFKEALQNLSVGEVIDAEGPNGHFTIPNVFISEGKKLCFIAGGIGITPFRSILLDLEHKNLPINVTLLYANRTTEIVFKEKLDQLSQTHSTFKVKYFIDPQKIDEASLKENIPDLKKAIFYSSGPEPMVESFDKLLASLGVPKENIKNDFFPGYERY